MMTVMADDLPKRRWFSPTPGWLVLGLLVVEGLLLVVELFRWLPKGWPVLIAIATVAVVTLLMLLWFITSLLTRWRFHLSVRFFLLLFVVVAIPFSWLIVEMKAAMKQKEMVEGIKEMGGSITYDYEIDQFDKKLFSAKPSAPLWLRNLLGGDFLAEVVSVGLWDTKVTDRGLVHLKGLAGLSAINLSGTLITDSGLEQLAWWPQLRYLYLDYTSITNLGLERLRTLRQLRVLSLNGTRITGDGLRQLQGLNHLRELVLAFTQVTDAGLEDLKGLAELQRLLLQGTKVTDAGVKRLQQALPNCKIEH